MSAVLKKFGRYFLMDQIAQGGMAEIYRARLTDSDGAGRLLVIKKIQASYGGNEEFLSMFKSEIKTTMGFNHPAIVQLYDFGEEEGQPYIAMEHVDGRNLRQVLNRIREQKSKLPVDVACYIAEQAAAGLHYAHNYRDKITGEPLNIVHRDVSPQNILVSYDGNVKVIDFGIAKATTNGDATRAGVIKGKPSYLSPEQISGEVLDGRSDVFALGAVVWELLTGKKLFAGDTDLAVLKMIESCNSHVKAPSTLNPDVPKELDAIIMKALAKQADSRYASAEEFQRVLHRFLHSTYPEFNPVDLSYYVKDLFKREIVDDRKKVQELNSKVEDILSLDIPEAPEIVTSQDQFSSGVAENEATQIATRRKHTVFSDTAQGESVELDASSPGAASAGLGDPGRTGVGAAVGTSTRLRMNREAAQAQASVARPQAQAPRQVHRKSGAAGGVRKLLSGVAALLLAALFGPDFGVEVPFLSDAIQGLNAKSKKPARKQNPAEDSQIEPNDVGLAIPEGEIALRLDIFPGGGGEVIKMNGQIVDSPQGVIQVALDQPLEIEVIREGFHPYKNQFVLSSEQYGGLSEKLERVELEPLNFGLVSLHTTPTAEATVRIVESANRSVANQGKPWTIKTPVEDLKLPVGTYSIRFENKVLGMSKDQTITVEEGKVKAVSVKLELQR